MYGSIFLRSVFFYVQRPGGRGLGGRVQSGDDLSVACGDSSPGRGAFSFRCGGDDLSVACGDSSPGRGAFDRVVNATAADILAYLAVKRKKFYWNLTFFDFSWYMSHGSTFGGKMQ